MSDNSPLFSGVSTELQSRGSSYWSQFEQVQNVTQLNEVQCDRLKTAFSLSDFIANQCISTPALVQELLSLSLIPLNGTDYKRLLQGELDTAQSEEELFGVLRRFRHWHMTRIAWLDVFNLQNIEVSLQSVSALANELINGAYQWLFRLCCDKYGTPISDGNVQPMLILGMGKLGGNELNFSSDIDLIFCYPEPGETQGGRKPVEHQVFFSRLGQKLISALNQITAEGQVYRVDMRLRPFGESGPLVMHFAALEDYYQSQGREWERYALVKARIINPDNHYAPELKSILKPFVFRRYLDFGAIDSLRNMKSLIRAEVRRRGLVGNIKLGAGGIREVEFIIQSFQLIRGGRHLQLQNASLLITLDELMKANELAEQDGQSLRTHYLFLRKLEHCLQQFDDAQTQTLPSLITDQLRLTHIMEAGDYASLMVDIGQCMTQIHQQFLQLIGDDSDKEQEEPWSELESLWQQQLSTDEMNSALQEYQLAEEELNQFCHHLNQFQQDMLKRPMGTRGQQIFDILMPQLIWRVLVSDSHNRAILLLQLCDLLKAIYRRTAYLELLQEHSAVLKQLIRLCICSRWIGEQIKSFPILLDDLLDPVKLYQPTAVTDMAGELRRWMLRIPEDDLEMQMEALRQFKLSQQLHIAAADVTGSLPLMKVSDHLTCLAEVIIQQAVELAWQQLTTKYGMPLGASQEDKLFAVIGFGKLGGYELGYGSDLDLVFVHQCDGAGDTDGARPIDSGRFYLKLAQRILHLFNINTSSGLLYEVDMRLRPSGDSGLLVCHVDSFRDYQLGDAWTWEHQALVRSRVVYGGRSLSTKIQAIRQEVLSIKRDPDLLAVDVVAMRKKMRQHFMTEKKESVQLKQQKGGMVDIEFLAQYLVLAYSQHYSEMSRWSDNVRIIKTAVDFNIIETRDAETLIEAYLAYRNRGHRLALSSQVQAESEISANTSESVENIWQGWLLNTEA